MRKKNLEERKYYRNSVTVFVEFFGALGRERIVQRRTVRVELGI